MKNLAYIFQAGWVFTDSGNRVGVTVDYVVFDYSGNNNETKVTFSFQGGQVFTPNSMSMSNIAAPGQSLVFTGLNSSGGTVKTSNESLTAYTGFKAVNLSGFTDITKLEITATSNFNKVRQIRIDDIDLSDIHLVAAGPTITSATYDAGTNRLYYVLSGT